MPKPQTVITAEYPKHPFLLTVEETAQALNTDIDKGLTTAQVNELHSKYPPNELDVGGTVPWYKIFAKQLFNAMILVSFRHSNLRPGRRCPPTAPPGTCTPLRTFELTWRCLTGSCLCHGS
jgi:hypothetical protein